MINSINFARKKLLYKLEFMQKNAQKTCLIFHTKNDDEKLFLSLRIIKILI
jgi:hypothetical protein